ncbi:MAG: LLM class flavin-dependent oxidoreductase [Gammaproteobacteria bacterium]
MSTQPLFEAEISPGMSPQEVMQLAALAEDAGFDRLGISCVALWPDTYQLQTLAATATRRIGIGSMVTNPYTRHPAVHAAALATLQEVSGGRAFAGFGLGAGLEKLGIESERALTHLRETVVTVQRLLRGERVDYPGDTVRLEQAALLRAPAKPVPLAIGTRSPKVMALAGELADIALVGARYINPENVETYRRWLAQGAARSGRAPDAVEVLPRVTLCVSDNEALAIDSVKRFAAHYLVLLGDAGPPVDAARRDAIATALEQARGWYFDLGRYDPPALLELIDAELARCFAVAGTPAQCAAQLRTILDLGFSGVSCNLAAVNRSSMYAGLHETLSGAAAVLKALR